MKSEIYIGAHKTLDQYMEQHQPKNVVFFETQDRSGKTYCRKLIPNKRSAMRMGDGSERFFLKPSGSFLHEDDFWSKPFMQKADMMLSFEGEFDRRYERPLEIYVKGQGWKRFGETFEAQRRVHT